MASFSVSLEPAQINSTCQLAALVQIQPRPGFPPLLDAPIGQRGPIPGGQIKPDKPAAPLRSAPLGDRPPAIEPSSVKSRQTTGPLNEDQRTMPKIRKTRSEPSPQRKKARDFGYPPPKPQTYAIRVQRPLDSPTLAFEAPNSLRHFAEGLATMAWLHDVRTIRLDAPEGTMVISLSWHCPLHRDAPAGGCDHV